MKKSVIVLILAVVLIIIVSPGIVGKLAENSVGENLNWAADESGELVVTSEGFDRGWFSSDGQHRIELGDGQLRSFMDTSGLSSDALPALLINTHIDHGIIPVSSMSRDEGSLAPGLGSAVSTLAIDLGDGETVDLPGTIYSKVGLGGDLDSRYVLEAGSHTTEDTDITWQPATINIVSSADSGDIEFEGNVGAMTFGDGVQLVAIDGLTFSGEQERTRYGFSVGDVDLKMSEMKVNGGGNVIATMQGLALKASSSLDDGGLDADVEFNLKSQTVPGFGDISIASVMNFDFPDAEALGKFSQRMDALADATDPMQLFGEAGEEMKDLVASGLSIDIEQLDITLPMGLVESAVSLEIPNMDRADFEWTSLLLSAVADIDIKAPEELIQMATSMNPELGAVVAMGYLKKEGDFYVMDAEFKKGLLKVNGVPIPIPLGAFQ